MFSGTFFLYLFIIISTTFFAWKSQTKSFDGFKFNPKLLLMSFIIHWVFCAFTRIGSDHFQYIYIISVDAAYRFENGEEIGFNGLSMLFYNLTNNAEICIFIFKTISLLSIYAGMYLLRKHIQLALSMLAYNVTFYFPGLYLISMSLAVSLVFLAGAMTIRNYHNNIAMLISVLGMTIHKSCTLMVVCFFVILVLDRLKIKMSIKKFFIMIIIAAVIITNVVLLLQHVLFNMDMFSDYEAYAEERAGRTGSGLFNYFLYAIFAVYVIFILRNKINLHAMNAIVVYYIFSMMFAIIGYFIALSRLNYYSLVFIAIAVPYYFYHVNTERVKVKTSIPNKTLFTVWCMYLFWRIIVTLKDYTSSDGYQLNQYEMYNPFLS